MAPLRSNKPAGRLQLLSGVILCGMFLSGWCTAVRAQTGADSLTLDRALQLVLSTNPALQQATEGFAAASARAREARSSYYPTASAAGLYTRLGPVASLEFPPLGNFELFPADNYDAHVGVHQTLFDFSRTSLSVDLAASMTESAADRIETVRRDLSFQTARAFYTILFLRRSIAVQDEQIAALNDHLLVTRKKVESGSATDFNVLTTQVRIAAAQDMKIDLENSLRKEEIGLRRLTGMAPDAPLLLKGEFAQTPQSANADSLLGAALRQRIEEKSASDAVTSAELQARVASAADNPSLSLDLAYGFKNGYIPDLEVLRGNYVVGFQVEVPLFNGFRTASARDEADANLRASQSHRQDIEAQIRTEVLQAISDLRASEERLQTSDLNVRQARTAVGMARVRYDAGVITNLDLLDAETDLEQAELSDLRALFNYVLSTFSLRQSVGEKIW